MKYEFKKVLQPMEVDTLLSDLKKCIIHKNLVEVWEEIAPLLAIINGADGETLEKPINKGVENLSKEEIIKAFLVRRNPDTINERGMIKRRAMEADFFVYDNWMPSPSEKFTNDNECIKPFPISLKTGILPLIFIFFVLIGCNNKDVDFSNAKIKQYPYQEYQKNDILIDKVNDEKLIKLDTILYFSDVKHLYILTLKYDIVELKTCSWNKLTDDGYEYDYIDSGFQKNGFIYMKDPIEKEKYSLSYKILLNKGLFFWNGKRWELINSGDL